MSTPVEAPFVIRWFAAILREIPGPTEQWATIIGSLAWPLVLVLLTIRFRHFIGRFLNTVLDRLGTDRVKFGPFELTPNSQVYSLDPAQADPTAGVEPDDVENMETLFEFISDSAGEARLLAWMHQVLGTGVNLVDFLTEATYAAERANAVADLEGDA